MIQRSLFTLTYSARLKALKSLGFVEFAVFSLFKIECGARRKNMSVRTTLEKSKDRRTNTRYTPSTLLYSICIRRLNNE